MTPFIRTDADGRILPKTHHQIEQTLVRGDIASSLDPIANDPDTTLPGSLSGTEPYDLVPIHLVAGQTYSFAYRGTPEDGIEDPYLALFGTDLTLITEDDDGGAGRSSLITYTATETGDHYLYLTSFYTVDTGNPAIDTGNYTVDVWAADPANDVPGTIADAVAIDPGTTYGHLEAPGDFDMYEIEMTEGMVYSFAYAGGIWGDADWDGEAGENIGVLELFDANGTLISSAFNYETGLSHFAADSGTYYLRVSPYEAAMTGGYTLDLSAINPADYDPLESLDWDSADNVDFVDVDGTPTAYVYFAGAGENFGETQGDSADPLVSLGWTDFEQQQLMLALEEYEHILGVDYEVTTDVDQATFRVITTEDEPYGARFYPQDPGYGDAQGIGTFNIDSGGWGAFPQSLERGGFSFAVILHEFGHAHGIAHPHDTGGGSEVMLGVTGSTGSYGVYDLNQGVYTVMSYNDAWDFHPDGPSAFTIAGIDNGWSATLGAFDIAVLQDRYGVHAYNEGDNVYALTDVVDDAFYQTIWDSGGVDEISYGGTLDAQIDLTAATLDYSPTGGGVISFLYNEPDVPNSSRVRGGFTIANSVVIENATGGSGDDVLIGNAAANVLTGNDGIDTLIGRDGDDRLDAGAGADDMSGGADNDTYVVDDAGDVVTELAGEGVDMVESTIDYTLGDNLENLTLLGTARNGTGNELDNLFIVNDVANTIRGGAGNDTISYEESDAGVGVKLDPVTSHSGWLANWLLDLPDGLGGYATGDRIYDVENVTGSNFNDLLTGNNVANVLIGLDGNDTLLGLNGSDVLIGGAGRNELYGGSGDDIFVFEDDSAKDKIRDFDSGHDEIDLSAFGIDSGDVKISGGKVFANIDGVRGYDFEIVVQGDRVRMSDIDFGGSSFMAGGRDLSNHEMFVV